MAGSNQNQISPDPALLAFGAFQSKIGTEWEIGLTIEIDPDAPDGPAQGLVTAAHAEDDPNLFNNTAEYGLEINADLVFLNGFESCGL